MNAGRSPLFCDSDLAARIERAEAELIAGSSEAAGRRQADAAGFVIPVAGAGEPPRKDRPSTRSRGSVSTVSRPQPPSTRSSGRSPSSAPRCKSARSPRRPGDRRISERPSLPPRILRERARSCPHQRNRARRTTGRAGAAKRRRRVRALARRRGRRPAHPDTQGVPWREEFPREVYLRAERDASAAGVTRYVALHDGTLAEVSDPDGRRRRPGLPARGLRRRTVDSVSTPRFCPPGSQSAAEPAATSPRSPPSLGPSPSRTPSAGTLTCCTPAPCSWRIRAFSRDGMSRSRSA